MNIPLRSFPPLLASAALLLACFAVGGTLAWAAKRTLASDERALLSMKAERRIAEERIARLAQEERELHGHLAIWDRLTRLRIVGEEQRLAWLDALARIRSARALQDLHYQIEPQKPWKGETASAPLEVRSSMMKIELALLHEGELLQFLEDLRASGNAYYAVRRCAIHRAAAPSSPAAPGLRAKCDIDLITMLEAKGKRM